MAPARRREQGFCACETASFIIIPFFSRKSRRFSAFFTEINFVYPNGCPGEDGGARIFSRCLHGQNLEAVFTISNAVCAGRSAFFIGVSAPQWLPPDQGPCQSNRSGPRSRGAASRTRTPSSPALGRRPPPPDNPAHRGEAKGDGDDPDLLPLGETAVDLQRPVDPVGHNGQIIWRIRCQYNV